MPNLAIRVALTAVVIFCFFISDILAADAPQSCPRITVPDATWGALNSEQRDRVTARFAVSVAEKGRFAKIVHVQSINESTAGTTAGAELGSSFGQARYIDRSNWQNYSATGQLGAGILGAVIGSMVDSPARNAYRLIYTLKSADGSVQTVQRVSASPIYVAPGLCVDMASFTPTRDDYCEEGWTLEIRSVLASSPTAPAPTVSMLGAPCATEYGESPPKRPPGLGSAIDAELRSEKP